MTRAKQLMAKLAGDLAELCDHQESTFERLRQALARVQALELALQDKEEYIKTLEARIEELLAELQTE